MTLPFFTPPEKSPQSSTIASQKKNMLFCAVEVTFFKIVTEHDLRYKKTGHSLHGPNDFGCMAVIILV